jgi:hypothetical protein
MKRGSKQTKESRAKISKAKTKDGQTVLWDFLTFAIFYISKAKGTGRNPVMAELVRTFIDGRPAGAKPKELTITGAYSVQMRKSLELHGYITYASLNTVDRRIRFISPTMLFPDSRCTKKLQAMIKEVVEDVRRYHRNKESKRSK